MKGMFMDRENFLLEIADKDEQFAISYELLCLLRWLVEHDSDRLKKMISRAVAKGLNEKIQHIQSYNDQEALEDAHDNMIEFFSTLEAMLIETIQEQTVMQCSQKRLMPAIEHIDTTACEDSLVQESIEKINTQIGRSSNENVQELLLREILKNWKPVKKNVAH